MGNLNHCSLRSASVQPRTDRPKKLWEGWRRGRVPTQFLSRLTVAGRTIIGKCTARHVAALDEEGQEEDQRDHRSCNKFRYQNPRTAERTMSEIGYGIQQGPAKATSTSMCESKIKPDQRNPAFEFQRMADLCHEVQLQNFIEFRRIFFSLVLAAMGGGWRCAGSRSSLHCSI